MSKKPFIHIRNLNKSYKIGHETVSVLNNINLDVNEGELVAVVGPSGAGKTTLVHTIGGLITPDSGEILIDGVPLDMTDDKEISRYRNSFIGFVFQNYSLLPSYTVLENVALPLILTKTRRSVRKKVSLKYLSAVGMEDLSTHRANQLSGGQRQRVSIARALVTRPKLIIADEPTGNLDSTRSMEIMKLLKSITEKKIATVIMVTHDRRLAQLADRVVHLEDGALIGVDHAA